jgi:hypothetical protein
MGSWRRVSLIGLLPLAIGCGGGSHAAGTGFSANQAGVEVAGYVSQRGTRGSILVFAYTDLTAADDPAAREPASVGTLAPDGRFDVEVPAAATVTLVFLADGSNDGVVDEGDPIALLNSPDLVDLQAGDRVQIRDAKIDFTSHLVAATVEVARAAGPARTPTPVPAS